jgi:alpha-tubulin suppressor-like RCC1 family protein
MGIIVICINNYTSLFMRLARYAAQNRRLRRTVLILTCAINCSREYRISAFCHVMLAWAVLTLPQVTQATTPPSSRPAACTEILAGATQDVTAFGVCRKVTNSNSRKACALTATNSLWTSWYTKAANGLVPGVSIASCVPNINGVCGSANGVVSPTPPTANLCSAGTATSVVTGTVHSWSCNGSGTGTNASCQAPVNFATCPAQTVNWSQASNNCSASIAAMNHNANSTVNNSATGYTGSVSLSCNNGNLTQSSASCSPAPAAACGPAHPAGWLTGGVRLIKGEPAPSINLCSSGTASAITTSATTHSWTCTRGTVVNCSVGISNLACWGWNGSSETGNIHATSPVLVPVPTYLPIGVASLSAGAAGYFHTCTIGNNGQAYCWGSGFLGDGTTSRWSPGAVTMPTGVTSFTAIAAGMFHTCAIGNNGRAYCWGSNGNGRLGDGTTTDRLTPVEVILPAGVTSFSAVSAGDRHTCAIGNNGLAYCWGENFNGKLGDGSQTHRSTPVAVTLPAGVTSFSAIAIGGAHTCAIGNNGRAYCWGYRGNGRLGDGVDNFLSQFTPVPVTLPTGVTSFNALAGSKMGGHTCGIGNNGRAYCWGGNSSGQLGDGSQTHRSTPVEVILPAGVTSFTAIAAADRHSCGIGNNGQAYCWGAEFIAGGHGATTNRLTPTQVTLPAGVIGFSAVEIGRSTTCALVQ